MKAGVGRCIFTARKRSSQMTNQPETESGRDFSESLAAATPTPGGGAAAARVALLATSLVRMVTGISLQKMEGDSGSDVAGAECRPAILEETGESATELAERFRALEAADIAVFDDFMSALRLPKESEEEKTARKLALCDAAEKATNVPLDTLSACLEVFELIDNLLDAASIGAVRLGADSDLGAALEFSNAAFRAAELNIHANLSMLGGDPRLEALSTRYGALRERFEEDLPALRTRVLGWLKDH